MMGTRQFGDFSGDKHDYVVLNMDSGHEKVSAILQEGGENPQVLKQRFIKEKLPDIVKDFSPPQHQALLEHEKELSKHANFEYSPADYIMLQDSTVEMIFAMSPYQYKALNRETYRVLKSDGIVVVAGTPKNTFFSDPFDDDVRDAFTLLDFFPPVVKNILMKVGSQTTHGVDISHNLEFRAYIKNGA